MPELAKRLLSAAVLAPPVALAIHLGGPWSAGLMALASAVGAAEFSRLAEGRLALQAAPSLAAALVLPLLGARQADAAAFWVVGALALAAWLMEVGRARPSGAPERVGLRLAGALFTGFGLFALAWLRGLEGGEGWTFLVLLATWLNDAAAYLGGRALGRHKLAPRISPGKTWEGAACGVVGAALGVAIARWVWLPSMGVGLAAALALGTSVAGPLGDLCKSILKRSAGAKDSGKLIPGHGGLLDRLDAVLFNAPLVLAVAALQGA